MRNLLTLCLLSLIGSLSADTLQIEQEFIFAKEGNTFLAGCPCKNRNRRGKPQPPKEGEKSEHPTKERSERK